MVVTHNFFHLYEVVSKLPTLSLPVFKENNLKIEFNKDGDLGPVYNGREPVLPFASSDVYHAVISNWRRLTPINEDCKSVYEVNFDVTGSNLTFTVGDTIGILPQNDDPEVDDIISHLGMTSYADIPYLLSVGNQKGNKTPPHVPVKSTLRYVLTCCLDIRSVVKKLFLLALSRHTKDDNERKVIEYLCSKEGSAEYNTFILNGNLYIFDLFKIFPSCKPPVEVLFQHLPRLIPRPYSIVNSSLKNGREIKICFSVMDIGNDRKGLTTGWLEKMLGNDDDLEYKIKNLNLEHGPLKKVPIYLRKNMTGFTLPSNLETPLILIGPGTGVAPYIGFLEEREYYKNNDSTKNFGEAWLFFGCRNPDLDFIYRKELNNYLESGTLTKLCTAFSRIDNNGIKYIQDALLQNAEDVVRLIKTKASIFLCGDLSSMATQIKEILVLCLVKFDDKTEEEATQFVNNIQKENRYIVDAWS